VQQTVFERTAGIPGARMNYQAGRFVDHQQVIILKRDFQGNWLGLGQGCFFNSGHQFHLLPCGNLGTRLRLNSIKHHATLLYPLFVPGAGKIREQLSKHLVKAPPVKLRRNSHAVLVRYAQNALLMQNQIQCTLYFRALYPDVFSMPRFISLKFVRYALSLAAITLLLAACGGDERDNLSGAVVLYEKAHENMTGSDFNSAIRFYEALEARFPFSNQAKQGQLDLIYCYYSSGQMESAIDSANQFERENPIHPRVDYAIYMRGLALFKGQQTTFQRWFGVEPASRPQLDARASFSVFSRLVQRYPDSAYAAEAQQRMVFLRNQLAKHQNVIAKDYLKRSAYIAALNRAKFSVLSFDGAPATEESLQIMVSAYRKLGMQDLAEDTRRVLLESFPDSDPELTERKKKSWYQFW